MRPDGTHGIGHNTLGMREQIKRVRQLQIDNGKRPVVWIPVYGMIIPHTHAFVDVVSEGESFMFDKPGAPDWIDLWGEGLLQRRGGPEAKGGPWLLAIGSAQKLGFVPIFLNYIKFYSDPRYMQALRAQYGLLASTSSPSKPQRRLVLQGEARFRHGRAGDDVPPLFRAA